MVSWSIWYCIIWDDASLWWYFYMFSLDNDVLTCWNFVRIFFFSVFFGTCNENMNHLFIHSVNYTGGTTDGTRIMDRIIGCLMCKICKIIQRGLCVETHSPHDQADMQSSHFQTRYANDTPAWLKLKNERVNNARRQSTCCRTWNLHDYI